MSNGNVFFFFLILVMAMFTTFIEYGQNRNVTPLYMIQYPPPRIKYKTNQAYTYLLFYKNQQIKSLFYPPSKIIPLQSYPPLISLLLYPFQKFNC